MRYKSIIIFIIFFGMIYTINTQQDKNSVLDKLRDKYSSVTSIVINCHSMMGNDSKIKIQAKKGNKFIIEFGDRLITSNGITLWNYSRSDQMVTISAYDESGSGFSVESLFFYFLAKYTASKYIKQSITSSGSNYILQIVPASKDDKMQNIEYINLGINEKTFDIKIITFYDGVSEQSWSLDKLDTKIKLQDKIFDFKIPENTKTIDLR